MAAKIFLGKYRVSPEELEKVGWPNGNSRFSYQAEEIDSGKKVVVEITPLNSIEEGIRKEVERHGTVATKLNHTNIHALHDFGVQDDHLVYVSENLEGTTVEEWVKTHGPMPVAAVLRIASQVVSALGAAGFHQIVHRAIAPKNVVLVPGQTAEGEWPLVKLLHFEGNASEYSGRGGTTDVSGSSSQYASPEQLRYGIVDFRSEIYSLGATMWFLFTGAPAAMGPEGPQAALLSSESGGIPEKVRRLLSKMLAVNPAARPRDPLAFYLQLQECLTEAGVREPISRAIGGPPDKPLRPSGMATDPNISPKLIGLAAILLGVAVLGTVLLPRYLKSRHPAPLAQSAQAAAPNPKPIPSPTPAHNGGPIVMLAPSKTPSPTPAASLNVSLVSFNPMMGTPGTKDFKVPTVTFRIDAASPIPVTEASFYIDSAAFNQGSAQNPPITLFVHTGIFLGPAGTMVGPAHPIERTIWLKSQENLFPNWFEAYNQSENATFRWTIAGQPGHGSVVKPLHKSWSSPRPTPEVKRAKSVQPD
jgi:serine/threonine-protein kinase